ncbi:MAG: hypothetical protein ACFFAH_04025 [Promethearchaeota archaeon]
MALNWTIEVIILLITTIIIIITFIITLNQFIKNRFRHIFYMMMAWFFAIFWALIAAFSHLFLSRLFHVISTLFLIPIAFCITFFVDSIAKERVDPKKMTLISFLSAAAIFTSYETTSIIIVKYPNGEVGMSWSGYYGIIASILALSFLLFLFYNYLQIHRKAPHHLKKYSIMLVFGGIFFILSPISAGVPITPDGKTFHNIIPGIFALFISIGALIISIIHIKQPKMAFILPFKALRLTVIYPKRGISIFSYTWSSGRDMIHEDLYCSMLHGISMIIKESIKRGNIRQIQTDYATIILYRDESIPIICAMAASNYSSSLKNALEIFSKKFNEKYSAYYSNPNEISQFENAIALINECFAFVPEYE